MLYFKEVKRDFVILLSKINKKMNYYRIIPFLSLFISLTCLGQSTDSLVITLDNPRNTIEAHLYYLQPSTLNPDLSAEAFRPTHSLEKRKTLARKLKQILDGKGLWVNVQFIPNNNNYIDSSTNQAIFTPFPKELPQVYVQRIDNSWYYSDETVRFIPELHRTVYPLGSDLLINLFPKFGHYTILGLAVWQYFGLLLLMVLASLLFWIFTRLFIPIVNRISQSSIFSEIIDRKKVQRISQLLGVFLAIRLIQLFLPALQLPINAAAFALTTIKIGSTILVVMIILHIIDILMGYFDRLSRKTESKMDEQLMPILKRGIQAIIVIGGTIQVFKILNIDITTLIAGLSIGGLAIALAAQDTVKNLFGSLTIFMDKPFQIGDWINFSGEDGTVEEVGFRSTRVRTFANSLIYVPNGKLADMTINNYGLRIYRRFRTSIGITYDTPPESIELFIENLREIILNHPNTRKDNFEVHLSGLGHHSIDILFYLFLDVPNWTEELKTKHEILLEIIKTAKRLGISFAFPTTSVHIESGWPSSQNPN